MSVGTVRRSGGGVYQVALEDGRVIEASLRGRLKREGRKGDRVVIGDRVRVAVSGEEATIEDIEPRRTEIVRRVGRRLKAVAANVDRLIAVVAAADPEPRPEGIDRLLVIAEANGLEGMLVVNKVDLPAASERAAGIIPLYRDIAYPVLPVSARSGEGVGALRDVLCSGVSALVGPSGAGKSSLLNAVQPELGLRTGELSRKARRGRHTTVSSRLIELECGGLVADTPGFGDVGLWDIDPDALDACFPEFEPYRDRCRFPDCSHTVEPECAVRAAVDAGEIAPTRFGSYRILLEEGRELAVPD